MSPDVIVLVMTRDEADMVTSALSSVHDEWVVPTYARLGRDLEQQLERQA